MGDIRSIFWLSLQWVWFEERENHRETALVGEKREGRMLEKNKLDNVLLFAAVKCVERKEDRR